MSRVYSQDLRDRVIDTALKDKPSARGAAARFGIGVAWQDLIDTGYPARAVCRAVRNAAAGKLLLSDAHIQDQVWLDRLFEAEWPAAG
jgi:hypothetical protein